MRLINYDNVNHFMGISINENQIISLWRYCSRGQLSVIIFIFLNFY